MIRYLLIVYIFCFGNCLVTAPCQDLACQFLCHCIVDKTFNIFVYLLCHRRREYSCVGTGISGHLLFIQFLDNAQGFIGADLEIFGAVILQFRQII